MEDIFEECDEDSDYRDRELITDENYKKIKAFIFVIFFVLLGSIILLFVFKVASRLLFYNNKQFSLYREKLFDVERRTKDPKITYFMTKEFSEKTFHDKQYLNKIEEQVKTEYFKLQRKECKILESKYLDYKKEMKIEKNPIQQQYKRRNMKEIEMKMKKNCHKLNQ